MGKAEDKRAAIIAKQAERQQAENPNAAPTPKKQMNYPLLLMQDDFDEAYGPIVGVPVTFFIGRDGTISRRHFGPVSKEQVEREIKALL